MSGTDSHGTPIGSPMVMNAKWTSDDVPGQQGR